MAPILGEDRGRLGDHRRIVDYARARNRPSISPEGKVVVVDLRMSIRERVIGVSALQSNKGTKQKSPAEPPGDRVLAFI
jgi:hypothetical protein